MAAIYRQLLKYLSLCENSQSQKYSRDICIVWGISPKPHLSTQDQRKTDFIFSKLIPFSWNLKIKSRFVLFCMNSNILCAFE